MRLGERFRRWRASMGYGVHSPLAYRIVQYAIRPSRGVLYYGEEELEGIAADSKRQITKSRLKRARLLLRLVAELQPSYVWISPGLPDIYLEAIRLAGCVVRIFDGDVFPDEISKADMIVAVPKVRKGRQLALPERIYSLNATQTRSLVVFDATPSLIQKLRGKITGGVLLDCVSTVIAVSTTDPALHSYRISNI